MGYFREIFVPQEMCMLKHVRSAIIIISLLLLFATIWIPSSAAQSSFAASRGHQNELLVLGAIKQIYTAEHQYLFNVPPPPGPPAGPFFGTLEQLAGAGLIDPVLGSGEKFGYRFHIIPLQRSVTGPPQIIVNAWPKVYRRTGYRSFFMNIDCGIKGADHGGGFAEWTDPVLDSCSPTIAYSYGEQAMQDLRTIASAEYTYQATVGNGFFGSFDQLVEAGLVSENLRFNYHLLLVSTTKPTLVTPATFKVWSTPSFYRASGVLSFFIDDTGVLRGADHAGQPANEDDPPIGLSASRVENES